MIILDTEGTGLEFEKHYIAEIAALKYDEAGNLVGTYHQFIKPEISMPAEAEAVHGLSDAFLADKPSFKEVADEFLSFVESEVIVIHNANYDVGMLNAELKRSKKGKFDKAVMRVEDSLALARELFPCRENNLDALCERLGVDKSKRTLHGALIDCELLYEVYLRLLQVKDERIKALNQFLPHPLGEDIPNDIGSQLNLHVALAELEDQIKKYKERVRDTIEDFVGENKTDILLPHVSLKFSSRKNVNHKGLLDKYALGLSEADLEEFTSTSEIMTIRGK